MKSVFKSAFVFGLIVYVSSCASASVETIRGPDGKDNFLITCGDVKNCYAQATQLCGTYKIVNTSSDNAPLVMVPNTPNPVTKLLVECTKP